MANLQDRIGPEVTKLYPNLTWKRPGLQSPSKNTVKSSQTRKSDEKDDDSDAPSHRHASSIFSSPNKSRGSLPRPRKSSGQLSLLSRMDLSSGASQDGHRGSEGKEAAGIQPSLLSRVGITEDKTPQPSLLSSSNGQKNAFVVEKQTPDDRHNRSSHNDSHTSEPKYDGLVVKPSATEPSSILQDSSKSNYSSSNIRETSQIRLEDNSAQGKNTTVLKLPRSQEQDFEDGELARLPPSQEQGFEDGELVDSEHLPLQQVRDFLLPLVLNNAAHRVKEGDGDLTRLTAHSVLSDEVCSSFMDQMKEVRTEMHAHQNRSSNPPEMQFTGEINNLGPAHIILPSSKIGQAPPRGPRAMTGPIITDKSMPRNATTSSPSKDQPFSALSNHSHDPVSSSVFERRGPGFRHSPSPERKSFHDHDRGRRYSQHRERMDDHRSRSHSHSPSRHSRGQPYHRPSDSSRHMARSRPPLVTPPGRRRSPPGPSQSTYFRDRALHESPEAILGPQSASPSGISNHNRIPERRPSFSRDFKRLERPANISPHLDSLDPPRSPVSRRHFDRPRADKVVSPHQPFTRDRGHESPRRRRDSYIGIPRSGLEFARRSVSPPRRKQYRRLSAERPLPRTPPAHSPRSATPNPYRELEERRDLRADHMESVSPGTGSASTHLTSRATGSHHPTPKPMVMENKDMHEPVNDEVRTPKTTDDMQKSRPGVLPCHNVPGIWFVKVALGDIGTLECSFEVDDVTALNWNLQRPNVNLPNGNILRKERLQLHLCCLSQKDVQSVVDSLQPDATAHDVATAMVAIENNWPTPGHLIIMVNPQDKNKKIWLPHKLESPCLPVCIEDCVVEGQNIVQFIQLSGMSERMFVLFATTKSLSDELQHEEVVLAPGYI